MKITYRFSKGRSITVEVDENTARGCLLIENEKEPQTRETAQQKNCGPGNYSAAEGLQTDETLYLTEEDLEKLYRLSEIERRRYLKHRYGMNYAQIARQEKVNPASVKRSVYSAMAKMGELRL